MNINEFRNQFPDEEVCRQYLEKAIWHQGRICPHCNNSKSWPLSGASSRKGLYECAGKMAFNVDIDITSKQN